MKMGIVSLGRGVYQSRQHLRILGLLEHRGCYDKEGKEHARSAIGFEV
jgi:hypothetical protein